MNDQQISDTIARLKDDAAIAGFTITPLRGDGQLQLVNEGRRITLESNQVHGMGRLLLTIERGAGSRKVEIEINGLHTAAEAYKDARSRLLAVIRRAMVVKP